jgi:hypothetical protein
MVLQLFPGFPGFLVLFGGAGDKVVGPITSGVSDPSDCGVDGMPSRSAMNRGGEIGQLSHDGAEAGRQKDRMLAGCQIGDGTNPGTSNLRR